MCCYDGYDGSNVFLFCDSYIVSMELKPLKEASGVVARGTGAEEGWWWVYGIPQI